MQRFAEFMISTLDLVGAQAREVGDTGKRAARSAALSLALSLLTVLGAGLLLASLVIALAPVIGAAGATCIAGLLAMGAGIFGMWMNQWRHKN